MPGMFSYAKAAVERAMKVHESDDASLEPSRLYDHEQSRRLRQLSILSCHERARSH